MCTTMIITKGATIDGSMMVAHSDDDELSDQRIIYVPARNHEPGVKREVFAEHYLYPRMVTHQRGPGYETPGYELTKAIGYIPQVEHTYAYFDGNYGIMNEHNLMMGECTNAAARYQPPKPVTKGPRKRIFYTTELSRVALERCTRAREAIELMGGLIERYGYYSSGETLLVADEEEAWVFECCALPDDKYHSVWVAQRVKDGEVFVAANEFRIREVKKDHPDYMYSDLLFRGLEKVGWWPPEDAEGKKKKDVPLDWLRAVSLGEYCHPYYSLRRVWRVLDRVNPDLGLSPWVEDGYTEEYPFSVKPLRPLGVRDVFSLYRDHYEGTQFDLTKGVAAGPYGDPHRFVGSYDGKPNAFSEQHLYGAWERAISVFYQGYTFVNQVRPGAPEATKGLVWFGPDVSYTTCFTPFPAKAAGLPPAYQTGDPQVFDCESAWWAFDFVGNWARLNFQRMTRVDILPLQEKLELAQLALVREWDALVEGKPLDEAIALITEWCEENAKGLLAEWRQLGETLIAKYSDGYINLPDTRARDVGYPATWLSETNYSEGPTTYDMKPR